MDECLFQRFSYFRKKNRMLVELPETRVLYINIRSPEGEPNYPSRDDIPARMLDASGCTEEVFEQKCFAFLTAIFGMVDKELSYTAPGDFPAPPNKELMDSKVGASGAK
jgi:hypothetical protein